jgi:hypothetical protein
MILMSHPSDSFPEENAEMLHELLLKLTSHSIFTGEGKVVCRNLFVAVMRMQQSLHPQWLSKL